MIHHSHRNLLLALLAVVIAPTVSVGETNDDEYAKRRVAVAMNMCRASFHRIRGEPSKRVLIEEQEEILNNLNLSWIQDEEVIRLYTSVLDEVGQIQIAEQERQFFRKRFRQEFLRNLGFNAFVLGTQLTTLQYPAAIRTGANTWWDYRFTKHQRDVDLWKVEKQRMTTVVDKSSQLLETFWKLTQKREIPDSWLVRGDDLDNLAEAMSETDPEVRLRVLKRMERFLECYPPYWYYVGRTQQQLGQLFAASQTYEKVGDLVAGHFRRDDMLAGALANRAAIQAYLHQPGAEETAMNAIRASSDVWQVNLTCARVLHQYGKSEKAEDAILRNVDVDLEKQHSLTSLVSLYFHTRKHEKLTQLLEDETVVRTVPVPVLLQAVSQLDDRQVPRSVVAYVSNSLFAVPQVRFGRDDLRFVSMPGWHLEQATVRLKVAEHDFDRAEAQAENNAIALRFPSVLNLNNPFQPLPPELNIVLDVHYPQSPPIRIHVEQGGRSRERIANSLSPNSDGDDGPFVSIPGNALRISKIDVGNSRLSWRDDAETVTITTEQLAPTTPATATKPEQAADLVEKQPDVLPFAPSPPTEASPGEIDQPAKKATIPLPEEIVNED